MIMYAKRSVLCEIRLEKKGGIKDAYGWGQKRKGSSGASKGAKIGRRGGVGEDEEQ